MVAITREQFIADVIDLNKIIQSVIDMIPFEPPFDVETRVDELVQREWIDYNMDVTL